MAVVTFKAGGMSLIEDISDGNLLHYIKRILPKDKLPEGFTFEDLTVVINGSEVNLREFNINCSFDGSVFISASPKGFDPLTIAYIVIVAISIAAAVILAPEIPSTETSKDSPNNSIFGQTNVIRLDDLKPNLYGLNISYPDLIVQEGGAWEYINNQKIIKETFLLGIGAYEKEPPKYELTPLSSITGSSYAYFEPMATVPVVQGQFNSEFIDGQVLLGPNNEEVTTGIVAESINAESNVDIVANTLSVSVLIGSSNWDDIYNAAQLEPTLLTYEYDAWVLSFAPTSCDLERQSSSGLITSMTINGLNYDLEIDATDAQRSTCTVTPGVGYGDYIKVSQKLEGSITTVLPVKTDEVQVSFDLLSGLRGTVRVAVFTTEGALGDLVRHEYTFTADTANQKFYTRKISIIPPSGDLEITLIRLNDDKEDGTDRIKVSQVCTNSYRNNVVYGNETILQTERKATQQALRTAESKINVECTRKTITYDINTSTIDYTLSASRSFVDAILHEYVIVRGLNPNDLPLEEMYTLYPTIPEGLGYFDYTFADKQQSIKSSLDVIANVARCLFPYYGDGYSIIRDEPKSPVIQFDSRNLDPDSPEEVSYRGADETSNNGVKLKWRNPDGNKFDYVYYVIQGANSVECIDMGAGLFVPALPTIPYDISLTGCATLIQAKDRADLECRKLIYIQKTLKITTLMDGENVSRGDVIKHADYYEDDIASGEISEINGNVFTTHGDIDLSVGNYFVTYTDGIGNVLGPVSCDVLDSTHFNAIMPDAYLADGYFIQCGTRFVISTIAQHEAMLYIVSDKTVETSGSVSFELAEYSDNIYPELD